MFLISSGAALNVARFDQETLSKVASVKVKEMKPKMVDIMDSGEKAVWDIVTPISQSMSAEGSVLVVLSKPGSWKVEAVVQLQVVDELDQWAPTQQEMFVWVLVARKCRQQALSTSARQPPPGIVSKRHDLIRAGPHGCWRRPNHM